MTRTHNRLPLTGSAVLEKPQRARHFRSLLIVVVVVVVVMVSSP